MEQKPGCRPIRHGPSNQRADGVPMEQELPAGLLPPAMEVPG